MTFAEEIEEVAGDEPIEGIVVGKGRGHEDERKDLRDDAGKLQAWGQVRESLNYEYDDGYGTQDCHSIYAWTESKVLFVHEYDGSTSVHSLPRNPMAIVPHADGGSQWHDDDDY